MGGGYSWLSEQYGLTCDTVDTFNLVLPNGTITAVNNSTNPDLFFALKGGLNRFGVVSSIVFKTVPQSDLVYAGIRIYTDLAVPALLDAVNTFQNGTADPKAQVILTINGGLIPTALLLMFYDGPEYPAAFDAFNNTGPLIDLVKTQTFSDFVSSVDSETQAGYRGAFHTMMTTTLTPGFLAAVHNESLFYGGLTALGGTALILSYDIEPFRGYGQHATESAFPHANSPLPLNLYYSWLADSDDSFWRGIMQTSIDHLTEVAKAEGIYDDCQANYPNYALSTYSGAQLYGTNVARLKTIQATYDPDGVMQQFAGGFSF